MAATTGTPATGKNRFVIAGFIVVAIGLAVFSVYKRRSIAPPKGWGVDFTAALAQGKEEGRKIVVLFVSHPSDLTRNLIQYTISKPGNREALKKGNFVPVMVRLNGPDKDELIATYGLKNMPTLILLTPDGKEIRRLEGLKTTPEVGFRQDFLGVAP